MRSRFHYLLFITTTLLLSLTSPLSAVTPNFKPLVAQVQTVQERQAEAERLLEEANSQFSEGQFQKALESFQQILSRRQTLSIYREIGYRRQERDLTFTIGVIYRQLGQYNQSLKYSQQTLALDRELGNRCQEQATLFRVSSVYGVLGQYDQVLEGLEKSLTINKELDEPCGKPYFFLLKNISDVYQRLGQQEKAIKTLEQVLAIYRKLGDRSDEQSILLRISEIYKQQKQYEQALAFSEQALAINPELGMSEATLSEETPMVIISKEDMEQDILTRIGGIYEQQGNYEQALRSYQQALNINRQSTFRGVTTLITLSRVYQRLGQYEQALESYQQALAADHSARAGYSQGVRIQV